MAMQQWLDLPGHSRGTQLGWHDWCSLIQPGASGWRSWKLLAQAGCSLVPCVQQCRANCGPPRLPPGHAAKRRPRRKAERDAALPALDRTCCERLLLPLETGEKGRIIIHGARSELAAVRPLPTGPRLTRPTKQAPENRSAELGLLCGPRSCSPLGCSQQDRHICMLIPC